MVGLLGLGVVGSGVARVLTDKSAAIALQVGRPVELRKVLVRDIAKARPVLLPQESLTCDPDDILDDPAISVVIEVMGGEDPAHQYVKRALEQGKHVITANKEVIAKHGPTLLAIAKSHQVAIHYEASVGGGIPLIAPFRQSLLANDISALRAIINGTTNYILTKMAKEGVDLPQALRAAQELGYAEPDPTNDVSGADAVYKLAILSSLAFHARVAPEQVYQEGIMQLTSRDFRYAGELGYAIKLLAIARQEPRGIEARVHPALIPENQILANVDGVFNAVEVEGDLTGKIMFYGRGAGSLPTTSAVVADLIELAQGVSRGIAPLPPAEPRSDRPVLAMADVLTRYYLRMSVGDQPGVLAQIAHVLGTQGISISSVIQKESDERAQTAEIVLMTHTAPERAIQRALQELAVLPVVAEIGTLIRVES